MHLRGVFSFPVRQLFSFQFWGRMTKNSEASFQFQEKNAEKQNKNEKISTQKRLKFSCGQASSDRKSCL
jgi:hypothetical protein